MRVPHDLIPKATGAPGAARRGPSRAPLSLLVSIAASVFLGPDATNARGAAPLPPSPIHPPDGAAGVPTTLTLAAAVGDPDGDSLTVRFEGRRAWVPGPAFTLALLPDTQYYTAQTNGGTIEMFVAQTEWIMNHREEWNIAFVTQLGDIVENGDAPYALPEWHNANLAMSILEDTQGGALPEGMPYEVVCGNHEQWPRGDPDGTTWFYNWFFGATRFAGRSYYGGHYGTNSDNHYALFTASGIDFLVVSLEFDLDQNLDVLAWADSLLGAYADRLAILSAHYLIHPGNPGKFGPQGSALYEALRHHPNLFLMVCGHVAGEGRRTEVFEGRMIHLVLSNYQNRQNGGNGWMRLMRFEPAQERIRTFTYSPYLDQWEADADSSSQFTLPAPVLRREDPWSLIGWTRVAAGDTATCPWPHRDPLVAYEWRVAVSDGIDSVMAAPWRFTTGPRHPLAVSVVGSGVVVRDPEAPDFDPGTPVTLTAWPETGWRFAEWQGDASGGGNPVTIWMDAPRSVTAVFADAAPPEARVIWPNGGDSLRIGEPVVLRWTATDNVAVSAADLYFSRSGPGGPFECLVSGLTGGDAWTWTVAGPPSEDAYLRVVAHDGAGGTGEDIGDAPSVVLLAAGARVAGVAELELILSNPARREGCARLGLPRSGPVTLRLFDISGRCLRSLELGPCAPGLHACSWRALTPAHAAAGRYYLRAETAGGSITREVVLLP